MFKRCGIYRVLLGDSPVRMDYEWHLHTFDLKYLRSLLGSKLRIAGVSRIPIPVGYVVGCSPANLSDVGAGHNMRRTLVK